MEPSRAAYDLIIRFEGFRGKAYKCPAGIWTISKGITKYPDGSPVKEGDIISISYGEKTVSVKVLGIKESTKKADAAEMYEVVDE